MSDNTNIILFSKNYRCKEVPYVDANDRRKKVLPSNFTLKKQRWV